jgi:hypothetical protein
MRIQRYEKTSTDQSPPEADSRLDGQEIPRILYNPKISDRIHKSQPLYSTLSQLNPVHDLISYFYKINVKIIPPSMSRCIRWSLYTDFPTEM